jgi:hypothetical protein
LLFLQTKAAINDTIKQIKANGFGVKVKDDLSDYDLSCKEKTKAWLGEPHLIKSLENKFGDLVKSLQ